MKSIGLAASANQIVMVLLRKGLTGDPYLENYRLVSLKEVSAEDREEILLSNIGGFIDENRGDRGNIFLGIPGNKVIFKKLSLPLPTEENLKEVLGFEMDRHTPFSLEDVYFDFKIVERDEARKIIQVLLMVVKKEVVEYYLKLLQKINVKLRGIEVFSTALYNIATEKVKGKKDELDKSWIIKSSDWLKTYSWGKRLLAPYDRFLSRGKGEETFIKENTRFLVNIDDDCCELGGIRGDVLVYSRCFNLTKPGGKASPDEEVKERVDKILSEIEATRLVLADNNSEISQLIVTGNGVDQDLIDYLREEEKVDARLLDNPRVKINLDEARQKVSHLSTAIGLALKGLKSVALDVNFIPHELRPKKKINWALVSGVTLMVLFLLGLSSYTISFLVKERIYLTELDERINGLRDGVREIERMQEEIARIEGKMESLEKIKADDISKLEILKELTQIIPDEMWSTRFSYHEGKGKREIELSGYADTASEIIPILEESELFEDVKFKSSIVKDRRTNKEKFNVTATISSK